MEDQAPLADLLIASAELRTFASASWVGSLSLASQAMTASSGTESRDFSAQFSKST